MRSAVSNAPSRLRGGRKSSAPFYVVGGAPVHPRMFMRQEERVTHRRTRRSWTSHGAGDLFGYPDACKERLSRIPLTGSSLISVKGRGFTARVAVRIALWISWPRKAGSVSLAMRPAPCGPSSSHEPSPFVARRVRACGTCARNVADRVSGKPPRSLRGGFLPVREPATSRLRRP